MNQRLNDICDQVRRDWNRELTTGDMDTAPIVWITSCAVAFVVLALVLL